MTVFEEKVYETVRRIPRSKVATYQFVACAMGCPRSARAAGNALNKNRNSLVPCHRVIRSDGSVGGFVRGRKDKIKLLLKEGVGIQNYRVNSRAILHSL